MDICGLVVIGAPVSLHTVVVKPFSLYMVMTQLNTVAIASKDSDAPHVPFLFRVGRKFTVEATSFLPISHRNSRQTRRAMSCVRASFVVLLLMWATAISRKVLVKAWCILDGTFVLKIWWAIAPNIQFPSGGTASTSQERFPSATMVAKFWRYVAVWKSLNARFG